MKRFGYKSGIIFGLLLFAAGAFLVLSCFSNPVLCFFPGALFIIACGLAFLETAANPYIIVLGDPATATQRINFAQSFNGLAAFHCATDRWEFYTVRKKLTAVEKSAMSSLGFE